MLRVASAEGGSRSPRRADPPRAGTDPQEDLGPSQASSVPEIPPDWPHTPTGPPRHRCGAVARADRRGARRWHFRQGRPEAASMESSLESRIPPGTWCAATRAPGRQNVSRTAQRGPFWVIALASFLPGGLARGGEVPARPRRPRTSPAGRRPHRHCPRRAARPRGCGIGISSAAPPRARATWSPRRPRRPRSSTRGISRSTWTSALRLAGVQNPELLLARQRVLEAAAFRQFAAAQSCPRSTWARTTTPTPASFSSPTATSSACNRDALTSAPGPTRSPRAR